MEPDEYYEDQLGNADEAEATLNSDWNMVSDGVCKWKKCEQKELEGKLFCGFHFVQVGYLVLVGENK